MVRKKVCLRAIALEMLELGLWNLVRRQGVYINIILCGKYVDQHFIQTWRLCDTLLLYATNLTHLYLIINFFTQ
jgi:hypothetical protein